MSPPTILTLYNRLFDVFIKISYFLVILIIKFFKSEGFIVTSKIVSFSLDKEKKCSKNETSASLIAFGSISNRSSLSVQNGNTKITNGKKR